ncbi:ABC transporter ATP-binding protein [Halomonas sp. McH1-25]|uniref:ABC transporter ATP-binding protein n=1 Tax=unclassified Halomonas TaxID=2609666 RepID=UPI001EF5EC88|nr:MULTISPECIES: ABC transporter ATP-binding protein [unclassified Halomonas]MCG7601127.1 ABC transporter ATP-binding protein [Halomonas sp. McH1-25]MCP1344576.1 ABC transporter ATP-binding protein [Halomonas sp. FL8]MCP1362590.1 ABC transporter ATP-binding protein [Halomonas sp. BBD45]MCP1363970.1 ABC transporter ATP-binding protein [Halomonas sp. BBD48]
MSFLRLESLTKQYGATTAAKNITLDIAKGEFVSLLGPSGCGKTTTLQMIAGFVEPTQGRILMDGVNITNQKANQRGIGIVFQSYALFPHMTVAENARFGLEMRRVPVDESHRRVSETLELVGLDHLGDRYPRELSGGQRQRVALARALVIRPPLLLLDEPLSNLDAKLRENMQIELRNIQQQVGTTTLMVTHDQSEALSLSDRVVVMNQGCVVQVDEPFNAYEQPNDTFVSSFVGKTNLLSAQVVNRNGQPCLRLGECIFDFPVTAGLESDDIKLSIRPERLELTDIHHGQLIGRVRTRLFLGNHWLYQIESNAGDLLVTLPNHGFMAIGVGDDVGVRWQPDAVRILKEQAYG